MLNGSYSKLAQSKYRAYSNHDTFGIVDNIDRLQAIVHGVEDGYEKGNWAEMGLSLRVLGETESHDVPAQAFVNAVILDDLVRGSMAHPVALIYASRAEQMLVQRPKKGYLFTQSVEGPTLADGYAELNREDMITAFQMLGAMLAEQREEGYFLMDLGPYNVVLRAGQPDPVFLQAREVIFPGQADAEDALGRQIAGFRTAYAAIAGCQIDELVATAFKAAKRPNALKKTKAL
ncbi:MAG: hypothetical protein ABH879_00335 [archaeon]